MRYHTFKLMVATHGWTLAQLRLDAPPDDALIRLIDLIGLAKLARFVHLLETTLAQTED